MYDYYLHGETSQGNFELKLSLVEPIPDSIEDIPLRPIVQGGHISIRNCTKDQELTEIFDAFESTRWQYKNSKDNEQDKLMLMKIMPIADRVHWEMWHASEEYQDKLENAKEQSKENDLPKWCPSYDDYMFYNTRVLKSHPSYDDYVYYKIREAVRELNYGNKL